jgi:hypothetical protein
MGKIYENARLTIAASWAADSSEGCFGKYSAAAGPIEVPYYKDGVFSGDSLFLTLKSFEKEDPRYSPLNTRA